MLYVLGAYTLDPEHYELRQAGELVKLEPRVFDLLSYLIQHPSRTVTKEELYAQVWPDQVIVSDNSLTKCVEQARKAIGDTGQKQRCIQTVRSRGYRFIAPIEVRQRPETGATSPPAAETLMPAEQNGVEQADAVAPPPSVPLAPPSAPPPVLGTSSTPHAARHDMPDIERRQLSVLVCRLVGVSEHAEPPDPEVLLEVTRNYRGICTEVVHRFAGHIAPSHGDMSVVYFGYPQAHEDDARRAVYTGLGIVAGVAEITRRLKHKTSIRVAVRVGIHTGVVVVGAMGKDAREQLALGEAPYIATQLQGLAAPDTIVISSDTWRLVEGYFVCEALGSRMLEDYSQALAVYQVLQESTAQSRLDVGVTTGLTPFVGREHEVGLLRERWQQAADGMGQVVLLSGEAGIGKSRVVQVFKEHMAEETYARVECHCSPYYQHTALYPVVTYLQRLLGFTREDPDTARLRKLEEALEPYDFPREEVVPLFAALLSLPLPARYPPLTLTPQRQKQKTLEALLMWLLKETERQPVCVIIEDLHWVDPSTLEWLSLLIDHVPTARVFLLLLFRPDFRPPWAVRSHITHLALSRLSPGQTAGMIDQVVRGKPLPVEVVQQVMATTDGVPLFVEELTKMVVEAGLVKEREEHYELAGPLPPLAIPATLHDSLMARLDRLGTAKQVAQLGAVVGREFSYEILQAIAPVEEATLQQELVQLVGAELLYQRGLPPQTQYVFKHALIQEAASQSLLRSTRRQYHQQIARVLEERFPEMAATRPELLAHHYTEAGLSAQAIPYWQQAGQQAIRRSANVEAINHLMQGLELLKALPNTPERTHLELALQLDLGPPLLMIKGHTAPEVEHTYNRAREICQQVGEGTPHFAALVGLWRFYLNQGSLRMARELGEQCFTIAQRVQDLALLQEAHLMLGSTLFYLGELVSSREHLEQSMILCDSQPHRSLAFSGGIDSGVACLSSLAWTLWTLGYPDQALVKCHKALTLAQQLSHAYSLGYALHFAATLHKWRREARCVQELSEAAIAFSSEQGFVRWLAGGMFRRGWALAEQGAVEEGIAQLCQGLTAWRTMGGELGLPTILAMMAWTYGRGGQAEEGLRVLDEAMNLVHKNAERYYEAELYRLRGELLLQANKRKGTRDNRQQFEEAERSFLRAIDVARYHHAKSLELRAVVSLSRLWQQQGKPAAARQMLAEISGWFTEGFGTLDFQEAKALLVTLQCPVTSHT